MTPSPLTTLVFDWGDTLMRVFPEYSGPMASWPQVEAVEGAAQALSALSEHYRLVVATNAGDSRSRQVRQALERVGLANFFHSIFTAAELGSRKPTPAFFTSLAGVLGAKPDQIAMIGDDYRADVLGATQAGWNAVWFNPAGKLAPGALPLYTLEVTTLTDLPAALQTQTLPDYRTCLAWLLEQPVSHSLLGHIHSVAATAYILAVWLRAAGQSVDPLLAHRGGLLHDLAKIKSLEKPPEQRMHHGELGARMLADRGEPVLAEITRRHPLFCLTQDTLRPSTWEQKLVHLADKLIEGSRLVTLDERITALRHRYAFDEARITASVPALEALQVEVCAALNLPAEEFIPKLRQTFLQG